MGWGFEQFRLKNDAVLFFKGNHNMRFFGPDDDKNVMMTVLFFGF